MIQVAKFGSKLLLFIAVSLLLLSVVQSATTSMTNLNWTNPEREGDADGPAWVVYSNKGYNAAAANLKLSELRANLVRKSDGIAVASYLFLGVNVYDQKGYWINCADAGLCLVGNGKWHAFINRWEPSEHAWYFDSGWWESTINLDKTHNYQLVLQTANEEQKMTLKIIDITANWSIVDTKTVDLKYSQKDGNNTSYYRDLAIDFPPEVCKDKMGKSTDDWDKVVEYNTNENLYVKNIHFYEAYLYNMQGRYQWQDSYTNYRFLWPDNINKVSYACTTVTPINRDYEDRVDLNLNKNHGR
jgi:hypothetical protein